MMTEDDRKKVFWLLKKYSSYTAWKVLGDAFQAFTDAWEFSVKKADEQDEFITEALKDFWTGCESFDKGLSLLKQGDHYVFRNKGNWLIKDKIEYARRLMDPVEYVHDWMVKKDEAFKANEQVQNNIQIFAITEKPDETVSASFDTETVFWTDTWPRHLDYAQFNFPPKLPEVPAPTEATVETGKEVPFDGIWEPEWIDPTVKKNRVINIRSLFEGSAPSNLQKGCMNYFVAGTIAPPYQDSRQQPVIPVRWRLIWQDTRYRDGVIPDEEAEYLAPPEQRPVLQQGEDRMLRIQAGKPCPRTGTWEAQDTGLQKRFYKEGDIMADLHSAYGRTVWHWVE